VELLAKGIKSFIVVGDTYRRDEVNRTHYPVFTQMEIVRTLPEVASESAHTR
jgi:tRNA synthetases class II core domain (F)